MKYNKGFIGVGVIIAIIVALAVGGSAVYYATKTPAPSSNTEENNYQPQTNQNSTIPPTTNTQAQNNNPSSVPVGTPTITVLSPNGGESWTQNSEYTIRWTHNGLDKNDQIRIGFRLSDASVCWSGTSSAGSDSLNVVPNKINCSGDIKNLKSGGKYKVQLIVTKYDSGQGVADESDNYFTIKALGGPVLTQSQAQILVHQTWSDCSQGDCGGVTVTVTQNSNGQYVVTAIFTELDDSTSQTKIVSIATYQSGMWALGQPTITRMCHRGNADGTSGWTAELCI